MTTAWRNHKQKQLTHNYHLKYSIMLDSRCNPIIRFGNCEKFKETWKSLQNVVPDGPKGNGTFKINPPFGFTPVTTPRIPYEPPTVSLARPRWEGWRYGSNYQITDGKERPYGFPDYQYYRGEYCGPCCPCVGGTNPPLMGDPQGKNPNIRYVQLDYKNLLGSGFAMQGPPQSQTSPFIIAGSDPGTQTSCGRDHCPECSGVYKKTQQPVKFQVCIGDQRKPETVQPCPVQPMKIYLPLSMLPRGGPDGDKADENEGGDDENQDANNTNGGCTLTSMDKQQFEVTIPGREQGYKQQLNGTQYVDYNEACKQPEMQTKCDPPRKSMFDPCGCCKACKNPVNVTGSKFQSDPRKCQIMRDARGRGCGVGGNGQQAKKSVFVRNC